MLELNRTQNTIQAKKTHSIQSVAAQTDLSIPFVRKLVREGKLRAKKIGSKIAILDSVLDEFLENLPDRKTVAEKEEVN